MTHSTHQKHLSITISIAQSTIEYLFQSYDAHAHCIFTWHNMQQLLKLHSKSLKRFISDQKSVNNCTIIDIHTWIKHFMKSACIKKILLYHMSRCHTYSIYRRPLQLQPVSRSLLLTQHHSHQTHIWDSSIVCLRFRFQYTRDRSSAVKIIFNNIFFSVVWASLERHAIFESERATSKCEWWFGGTCCIYKGG